MPSATPDPGPQKTNQASIPTAASSQILQAPQSQQTTELDSKSGVESLGSRPVASSAEDGDMGQETDQISPNYDAGTDDDPEQPVGPKVGPDNNVNGELGQTSYPETAPQSNTDTDPVTLPRAPWIPAPATTIDGEIIQPLSNGISVAGTTLTPGGPAVTVSGTPMSLGSDVFAIGTSTVSLATDDPTQVVTTIAGQTITANPTAVEVDGSQLLLPGSPGLTLGGTQISLDLAGQLVVGSKTIPLKGATDNRLITTVAGYQLSANPTAVQVGASTLMRPGGLPMTLSGTMISLDSSSKLIVGSTTINLQPATSGVLDRLVVGGFLSPGSSVGSVNVTNPRGNGTGDGVQIAFLGDAISIKTRLARALGFWILCVCLIHVRFQV